MATKLFCDLCAEEIEGPSAPYVVVLERYDADGNHLGDDRHDICATCINIVESGLPALFK